MNTMTILMNRCVRSLPCLLVLLTADVVRAKDGWEPGASPRIAITDCVSVVRDQTSGVAHIDRLLDNPRGYRWDAPGARVRFRTDSLSVAVHLNYSARHLGPARNSVGFYRVDGRGEDAWRFTRPSGAAFPGDAELVLKLPVPADEAGRTGAFHDYELILPYGDAVELRGIAVSSSARWERPVARPKVRWVAYGDSVTHGFTASSVAGTYPFLVGEAMGWEVINAGIGGRAARSADADVLSGLDAHVFSIAIGVNNWQGGTEPRAFRTQMRGLLERLLREKPAARIYVITPLWVPPSWSPSKAAYPLEDYRKELESLVAGLANARLRVIDGATLIDHDPALFDRVAVHPNDAGFAQMAERLTAIFSADGLGRKK